MREEDFEFHQDKKSAWLYGLMYLSIIALSLYFAAIQHYSGGTFLFYVFMFSAWYALFSGFNVVFAHQMRVLPHSIIKLVIRESDVEIVRRSRPSQALTPPLEVVRQGAALRIVGQGEGGKKSRVLIEQTGSGGKELLDEIEKSLRRLHRRVESQSKAEGEASTPLSGP